MCSCEIHKRLYLRNCHVSSLSSYDGCTTWNIQTLWPPAKFWRRSSCACMAHRVKKITSQTFLPAIWVCVPCPSTVSCWAKYSLTCAFWIDLVCYLPWKFHLVRWVVQRIHVGLSAVKQKLARKKNSVRPEASDLWLFSWWPFKNWDSQPKIEALGAKIHQAKMIGSLWLQLHFKWAHNSLVMGCFSRRLPKHRI